MHGLLLDLDDTLVDTRRAMVAAITAVVRSLWPGSSATEQVGFAGDFVADPGGHLRAYTDGHGTFAEMREARLRQAAAAYDLAVGGDTYEAFEAGYDERFPAELTLHDDVLPLLDWAAANQVPVGLLTNSGEHATRIKLQAVGLVGAVDVVVTRETVGIGKPDRAPFLHACTALGMVPAQVLHVGDSMREDYVGAVDAGLMAALLVRPGGWFVGSETVRTVASLSQVPALLAA